MWIWWQPATVVILALPYSLPPRSLTSTARGTLSSNEVIDHRPTGERWLEQPGAFLDMSPAPPTLRRRHKVCYEQLVPTRADASATIL